MTRVSGIRLLFAVTVALAWTAQTQAQEPVTLRDWLVLAPVTRGGRAAVHSDPVEAQLVAGTFREPHAGDTVALPGGEKRVWTAARSGGDGWLHHDSLRGGYACAMVTEPRDRVVMLEAAGHTMAYVNGEPRAGDPYGYGYVAVPVQLRAGRNVLLFPVGRGGLRVELREPRSAGMLDVRDVTTPDVVVGSSAEALCAVVVANTTNRCVSGWTIEADAGGGAVRTRVPTLLPLSVRKVAVRVRPAHTTSAGTMQVRLALGGGGTVLDRAELALRVRNPLDPRKVTFVSSIDGSVQYYGWNPAHPAPGDRSPRALVLTLHGASVEGIGQAQAYSSKSWAHIVAPTNRRPYGFDWEDWGRLDALEVLDLAKRALRTDSSRTYLTGHSMGGHGSWHLSVTRPDLFAAVGPSSGWVSFMSYTGGGVDGKAGSLADVLRAAMGLSDTLALARNIEPLGVYILHGDADDNVPVTEARTMSRVLAAFHHDYQLYEQHGAGHWWDASPEPGTDCVDWAPMFDMFARRRIPSNAETREVDLTSVSPGVTSTMRWVRIEQPMVMAQPSHVRLRCDPLLARFSGEVTNVRRLALDCAHLTGVRSVTIELDRTPVLKAPVPSDHIVRLAFDGLEWKVAGPLAATEKRPERFGPFRDAFRNRFMLVYGTHGTVVENALTMARARYDAETFWYRGNGSVDVIPDTVFHADRDRDRGVVLYGNADTNSAWKPLLDGSPVEVRRGAVRVGTREFTGDDLACLVIRPRPGSRLASVAAVAGSGLAGIRLTERLPIWSSGIGLPDVLVVGSDALDRGLAGVRAAGFFGQAWGMEGGVFAWGAAPGADR